MQKQSEVVVLQNIGVSEQRLRAMFSTRLPACVLSYHDYFPANEAELVARLQNARIVVTMNYPIRRTAIEQLPDLEMIAISFTGMDHVDVDYAKERGIYVANVQDYATNSVAELTIGLALSLLRRIPDANYFLRRGYWQRLGEGNELAGKTVGIIGLGKIGLRVAELFGAFMCKTLAWNRTPKEINGVKQVGLEEIAKNSDIVTVHLALTEQTRGLVGKDFLERMKPTAVVINTSRGPIVNSHVLFKALKERRIAGAALDVFEVEPIPRSEISLVGSLPRLIATPHIGYFTEEALKRKAVATVENIMEHLNR